MDNSMDQAENDLSVPLTPIVDGERYELIVAFTDASQSFANGFEAGILFRDLQEGDVEKTRNWYNTPNVEQLQKIANALGFVWCVEKKDKTGNWTFMSFEKSDELNANEWPETIDV